MLPGPAARRAAVCLAIVIVGAWQPLRAQTWYPPTTDFFSSLVWIEAGLHNTWRGIDRGDGGLRLGIGGLWGNADAGATNLVLNAEARGALSHRTTVSEHLRAGALILYRITDDATSAWVSADGFLLPRANTDKATFELAAGLKVLMPFWLPERRPYVLAEVRRDLSRYEATYARAALRLDYKFGVRHGAMVEFGHAWSELPFGEELGALRPGTQLTDVSLTFLRQTDPAASPDGGVRSVEPFLRYTRAQGGPKRNLVNVGVRVVMVR